MSIFIRHKTLLAPIELRAYGERNKRGGERERNGPHDTVESGAAGVFLK